MDDFDSSYRPGRHLVQVPGLTNVPGTVLQAISTPTIDHRGQEFAALTLDLLQQIKRVFCTEQPVVMFPGSGTAAWEVALTNTCSPGDRVFLAQTGQFSTLWGKLARKLGLAVQVLLIFSLVERAVRLALSPVVELAGLWAGQPAEPTGWLIFVGLSRLTLVPATAAGPAEIPRPPPFRPESSTCSASIPDGLAEEVQVVSVETTHSHVLKARLAAEERAEVGAEHGGEHRDRVERRRDRPRLDAGEIAVAAADSLRQVRQGQFARLAQATQLTADVAHHVNPFDLTKVWPHSDYPLIEIGKMVLDRNPDNYFAEVEQAAFDPGHFVPGIGPSPDKMLQGRLFAYGDAHRYRLGINHTQPPINGPHATEADNYGRDGSMRFDAHYGHEKNYEPNSFGGPAETGEPLYGSLGGGPSGTYAWDQHDGDDFSQAGALYRLMPEEAKGRLVDNIASGLAQVSKDDIVE